MSIADQPKNFVEINPNPFDLGALQKQINELETAALKATDAKSLYQQIVNLRLKLNNYLNEQQRKILAKIDELEARRNADAAAKSEQANAGAGLNAEEPVDLLGRRKREAVSTADLATLEGRLQDMKNRAATRLNESLGGEDQFAKIAERNGKQLQGMLGGGVPKLERYASNVKMTRQLLSAFADEGTAAIAGMLVNEKGYQTILEARRNKKDKGGSLVFGALQITARNYITNISKAIGKGVDGAKTLVLSSVGSTKLGQSAINAATKAKEFGSEVSGSIKDAGAFVKKFYPGKFIAAGADWIKIGGIAGKSAINSILPSAALLIAFQSLPLAIGAGVVMAATKTVQGVLADSQLTNISFVDKFKRTYGWGQFRNNDGSWNIAELRRIAVEAGTPVPGFMNLDEVAKAGKLTRLQELQLLGVRTANEQAEMEGLLQSASKAERMEIELAKRGGNVFGNFAKGLRAFNAFSTFGSFGAAIATVAGFNPVVGGLLAGGIAGGISISKDLWWGAKLAEGTGLVSKLSQVPFMDIVGQIQANLWVADQLNLIHTRYHGDVGKYLDEHFNMAKASEAGWGSLFMTIANYGNALNFILPFGSAAIMAQMSSAFGVFEALNTGTTLTKLANFTPLGIASTVGTFAALAMLSAAGVTLGPIAVIAATIGGLLGCFALAAFASTGVGAIILGLIGGTAGAGILGGLGSLFDKAINGAVGNVMTIMAGISAFLNFLSLMQQKLDIDNLVVFLLSLIAFIQTFDKLGGFGNSNTCIDEECKNKTGNTGVITTPKVDVLGYYQVNVVSTIPLSPLQRQGLIAYLDQESDNLHKRFPGKQIFINVEDSSSFESDTFVMLAVDSTLLTNDSSVSTIATHVNSELGNLSQVAGLQNLFN